jgi:adenylate cyclase
VLAVFPADPQKSYRARNKALKSARAIVDALPGLANETGIEALHCSTGIAYGSVTYGNVGSQERLDFTVIGQAANVAARLGDYGKSLGHQIVVSADVLKDTSSAIPLGEVELHNVSRPVNSYAIPTT